MEGWYGEHGQIEFTIVVGGSDRSLLHGFFTSP